MESVSWNGLVRRIYKLVSSTAHVFLRLVETSQDARHRLPAHGQTTASHGILVFAGVPLTTQSTSDPTQRD